MEESDQSQHTTSISSSNSTSTEENSGAALASATNSQVQEEETAAEGEAEAGENRGRHTELIQQRTSVSYNAYSAITDNENGMGWMRDDCWSFVVIVLTFWFFVSMTMIMGVYGSTNLLLGPYSSVLIKPNSFFVEYVKIEELYEAANGPTLYGFYKSPPLDATITWSDTHNATLLSHTNTKWMYFLNEGSQINISYFVNSPSSSFLVLAIAQGYEGFIQWLEDPSSPNTTLSWQVIQGSGMVQQYIFTSSSYYVAICNLNAEAVEVQLNVRLRAFLYNTTGAYYKCNLTEDGCGFKLPFAGGNAALLTSPGPIAGGATDEWHVKLSYGPRWLVYLAGVGGMTFLMLAAFHFLNHLHCTREDGSRIQFSETRSARTPLLSNKDDDLSSWGSSYDSVSQDEEDPEDEKSTKDGEYSNNVRRLCAICFDAPRDCFFLPCGHCVACYTCGTRIAEAAGTCPFCRRRMKKVRKIFTV